MQNQNPEAAPAIDRAFLNVISTHKKGTVISDLSAALKQVTAAVQQAGRAGKVILTMELRPASKGNNGTMVISTRVKSVPPEEEAPSSIFYADGDFNLVREDPNQAKFDLREPSQQQQPESLREAGDE